MDKFNRDHLKNARERKSVLNWGTRWEIRRYALIAAFLDAYQADWDFDNRHTVGHTFEALPLEDRIDVALHTIHSGYAGDSHPLLSLDENQFSETQKLAWHETGWKTLLCDAEKLTSVKVQEPTDVIFRGPIANLLTDYRKFTIRFRSALAHGELRFRSNQQNHSEVELKFKSSEPSGIVLMLQALRETGWAHIDRDASFSMTQTLEFHAIGDSHTQATVDASALAVKYVQILACMRTNDVSWTFDSAEVSGFDISFIQARTEEIKKVLKHEPEIEHIKVASIGSR